MEKIIKIGCSSYYNKKWVSVFYPEELPSKEWFNYYSQHFDSFEINSTFYKFPTAKIMENWYNRSPSNFIYSVKVPKEITHLKKLKDCEERIGEFYTLCKEGLKEKLGCILFQFPPSYTFTPENLYSVLRNLNATFDNVVEFRHESWWNDEVIHKLTSRNISFCSVSHPSLPQHIVTQSPIQYLRLHGNKQLFYSKYTEKEIDFIKYQLELHENKKKAFIYFNNTASEAGIINAQMMKDLVHKKETS